MNLEELRQAMASDATKENERLKSEIKLLRKQLHDSKSDHEALKNFLIYDCRALANRCWALTLGSMCCLCELNEFKCPHALNYKKKVEAVKELTKEVENKNAEN